MQKLHCLATPTFNTLTGKHAEVGITTSALIASWMARLARQFFWPHRQEDHQGGHPCGKVPYCKLVSCFILISVFRFIQHFAPFSNPLQHLHIQYNFVGRLLGPRGNSLKRLEATTECRVLIRGRGSIKDQARVTTLLFFFSLIWYLCVLYSFRSVASGVLLFTPFSLVF